MLRRLSIVLGVAGGAVGADAQEHLTPREFCISAESTVVARRICEADFTRSLELYLRYGVQEGYLKEDGDFAFGQVFRDLWSWRTLVGLPPQSPFLDCSEEGNLAGTPYDFRAIWDCIASKDPRAARMDAI